MASPTPERKKTEREVLLSLASKIFIPLCREVVLEKRYRMALEDRPVPGLEIGDLGMGTVHTWHGTPGGLKLSTGGKQTYKSRRTRSMT